MNAFQRTIDALAKSRNEAATPVLVAALTAGGGAVFNGAISALCARRSKAGHLAVLKHWHSLTAEQKQMVERGRSRMGGALRDALLDDDDQLFSAALEFVDQSGDFDLIPTLVMVAEQGDEQRAQLAMALTMRLVDQLTEWLAKERAPAVGRDPTTIRYCVLESLERSVERFRKHQRTELLEAFIVLAGPYSTTLRAILGNQFHGCFQSLVETLATSQRPGVLTLLTAMLLAKETPHVVQSVISKRTDRAFVELLLGTPLDLTNQALARNLARIKSIACCEDTQSVCGAFSPSQQAAAVRLLAASGAPDDYKLMLVEALLRHGATEGRVAACESLHGILGQHANRLLLEALEDGEGPVQAAAIRQLRERRIPGTISKLVELVGSPIEEVSTAAREALSVFSFDSYFSRFDVMDEAARRSMGLRVAKIDRTAIERLKQELSSPVRRSRLRALEMIKSMEVAPLLADALVERLADEDHLVRASAAETLQYCTADDVRNALLQAIGDRSAAVQQAVRNSLRAIGTELPEATAAVAAAEEEV